MHKRIIVVLLKLAFCRVEGFRLEQRAAIKFCVKLNKTATETFEILKSAYGEECLSRTSVFDLHKRFKAGRESLQDHERKGRPSTSRTEESTEVIQKCSAEDRTLSVRVLEELTGISRETVRKILVEDLKKKKVRARFVSHLLTPDQKHQRVVSEFWGQRGITVLSDPPHALDLVSADFFYFLN
jgi:transposase